MVRTSMPYVPPGANGIAFVSFHGLDSVDLTVEVFSAQQHVDEYRL